jgi:hypothetical protein
VRDGKPFVKRYEIRLDDVALLGMEARQPGILTTTLFDVRQAAINSPSARGLHR